MSAVQSWGPTAIGKTLMFAPNWQLTLNEPDVILTINGKSSKFGVMQSKDIQLTQGLVWSSISFTGGGASKLRLKGLSRRHGLEMIKTLREARKQFEYRLKIRTLISAFKVHATPILDWSDRFLLQCRHQFKSKGWLTAEFVRAWSTSKPAGIGLTMLDVPEVVQHVETLGVPVQKKIRLWRSNIAEYAAHANEQQLDAELKACKAFFDTVEKSSLTAEQSRAVICFDNRIQVIASAGSGKTSTIVAKAGYALHRGFIDADRMLLLAFNADAAKELQQRIQDRLKPLGLSAEKIVARTFHAFGLDVIGAATGKRPSLAPWLEHGGDIQAIAAIVDHLKDTNAGFRTLWDLFRVVLARDLPKFGSDADSPEDWDRDTKARGFRTLQGEVVKSHGERMICDWLFYNGVNYRYEDSYKIDTADPTHRQYRPDFYYPDVDVYHEHWALDANGLPPEEFAGYLDGVTWKRQTHKANGTTLIETTMAQLWSGQLFTHLEAELTSRGVRLDPNPDRPALGRSPIETNALVTTFRTFLTHAKSNRLSNTDLRNRLSAEVAGQFRYRHETFLTLFESIRDSWECKLVAANVIDFEDMLNQAIDHLEAGRWISPFELVMVDEFQDASQARARMTRALVGSHGKYLFAVGDDWQSINRFAGADISVMTAFQKWFGTAVSIKLQQTFRCPQSICDLSSSFVQKNPNQIVKEVRSTAQEHPPSLAIHQVEDLPYIKGAVRAVLERIRANAQPVAGKLSQGQKLTVLVLGRYRRDKEFLPAWSDLADVLEVNFLTIHGSKGLEADYVIMPRVVSGSLGFPSSIVDDPVLRLAMPDTEDFALAEERRLFYVALTRAKRSITLITIRYRESSFVTELIKDHKTRLTTLDGHITDTEICPKCEQGSLVPRKGPYGPFKGCNRFPKCDYKFNAPRKRAQLNR